MTVKKIKRRRIPASRRKIKVDFSRLRREKRGNWPPYYADGDWETLRMEDELTQALHNFGNGSDN